MLGGDLQIFIKQIMTLPVLMRLRYPVILKWQGMTRYITSIPCILGKGIFTEDLLIRWERKALWVMSHGRECSVQRPIIR